MNAPAKATITQADVNARKQRWIDFISPDAKPGFIFHVGFPDPDCGLPPTPPHWPDRMQERIEHKWTVYQHEMERASWLEDDYIPHLSMLTGTEIFAEAFGCRVERPEDNMPFALPLIHSAAEVAGIRVPEVSTSSLAYLFDMADELRRRAGPEALLRLPDVQSPMDIAALIWEKSSLFMGILTEPNAVKDLAAMVSKLLTAFLNEWFSRYGHDYISHYPTYFMRGGMTLSEDEIGVVSPDTFEEFFLPELANLSERFGGIGIHCCADARHQWSGLKRVPGLRLLNLNKPPTRGPEYVTDAYEFFADHCAQWHGGWQPAPPYESWPNQLPTCRFMMQAQAGSKDEAKALCRRLNSVRDGLS